MFGKIKSIVGGCLLSVMFLSMLAGFLISITSSSTKSGSETLYVPSGEVPASKSLPWESGGSGRGYDEFDTGEDVPECALYPEACEYDRQVERDREPVDHFKNCSPAYPEVCIAPAPPDLNCKDIPYKRFKVLAPDPHNFDGNKNGIGCE